MPDTPLSGQRYRPQEVHERPRQHFTCDTCGVTRTVPWGWGVPICAGLTWGHGPMHHDGREAETNA